MEDAHRQILLHKIGFILIQESVISLCTPTSRRILERGPESKRELRNYMKYVDNNK